MPTILRIEPLRVYFYSNELGEPPHVHVDRDRQSARFWLDTLDGARNLGFGPVDLGRIKRILKTHQDQLREAWHEHFGE